MEEEVNIMIRLACSSDFPLSQLLLTLFKSLCSMKFFDLKYYFFLDYVVSVYFEIKAEP